MRTPRSKYVREAIKGLPFDKENRKYLHDLLQVEHYVLHGPRSFAEAMHRAELERAYRGAFHQIHRELNPDGHERALRADEQMALETKKLLRAAAEEEHRQLIRDRELWSALGGALDE